LLLASLSKEDFFSLSPQLESVHFKIGEPLSEPHERIAHVYFMTAGLASTVAEVHDGTTIEVGITGREGLTGSSVLLGVDRMPHRVFIQIAGTALRIRSELLVSAVAHRESLRLVINKHIFMQGLQVGQTAACNRAHDIRERLARWLLMTHDRIETEIIPLTHEFLALMLGARRSSVTVAAGTLQNAGIIEYRHGSIRVINRTALEDASCDCYGVVQVEHERLLPLFRANRPTQEQLS
jgi:CRP-like cAMP-binding protein